MLGRLGRSAHRPSAAVCVLVLAALAGCAATGQDAGRDYAARELAHRESQVRRGLAGARDAQAEKDLQQLACRIAPAECASLRIYVVDAATPKARAYANGMLLVHDALFEQLDDEAELVFALAHEIAHLRLGHFSVARGPELELAADAWATARLRELGYRPDAGISLLDRLQRSEGATRAQAQITRSRLQALRGADRPG